MKPRCPTLDLGSFSFPSTGSLCWEDFSDIPNSRVTASARLPWLLQVFTYLMGSCVDLLCISGRCWGSGELPHKTTSSWTAGMVSYSGFPLPASLAQRRCSFIQQMCTEHLRGDSAPGFTTEKRTDQKPALIDMLVRTSRWTNQ